MLLTEFQYLHMLCSFFETADKFPTVQTRSEVIRRSEYEFSPLENAIRAIDSKLQELQTIISKVQRDATQLKTLTQILQGRPIPQEHAFTHCAYDFSFCLSLQASQR